MKESKIKKINRRLKKKENMLAKSVKKDIWAMKDEIYCDVFKRKDYSFLESLINNKNRINRVIKKIDYDVCPIPKDLKELMKISSEIWMNERIMDSKPKYFKGDIIITDPCYVLKHIDREKVKYIARDTIYGDWSCTTFNTDTKEAIGKFCADSGMVAVISLDDVLAQDPTFDDYKTEYAYTVIRDFEGYVHFKVDKTYFEYEGKRCADYNVHVVGKGNINFITSQTGL